MKKVLSRILAVAIAIVLFAAPITTQAATIPTCWEVSDTTKVFLYRPDNLELPQYQEVWLENNVNGGWFDVPAGKSFTFKVALGDGSDYNYHCLTIYKLNYGKCYESPIINAQFPVVTLPPSSTNESYFVTLKAYTNIKVDNYISIIE